MPVYCNKIILFGIAILSMLISSNSVPQNTSDATATINKQNTVKTTPNNNSMNTSERQAAVQKHNIHRVGPVPNEPNIEPLGSHAL